MAFTFAVPDALGVKLAEQPAVPRVGPMTVLHGEPVKPPAMPVSVKVIAPVGVVAVPGLDGLSVAVAVQVDA